MSQHLQKTKATRQSDVSRAWHLIDVKDTVLGRIVPSIVQLLRGKGKPYFVPNLDCGDEVVVINASYVVLTGNKFAKKVYTRYSGYPGGLKKTTAGDLKEAHPEELVRHAVSGMLPKNKLRDQWLTRLHVYEDDSHPYANHFS